VVGLRTREVVWRLALGAIPDAVRWVILRQMLLMAIAGVASGCVPTATCARILTPLLFGVERFDAGSASGVATVLMSAALAASYIPVTRASRVDSRGALRGE
jgi:ABC-type lipoprotein release transport system permease subunit